MLLHFLNESQAKKAKHQILSSKTKFTKDLGLKGDIKCEYLWGKWSALVQRRPSQAPRLVRSKKPGNSSSLDDDGQPGKGQGEGSAVTAI